VRNKEICTVGSTILWYGWLSKFGAFGVFDFNSIVQ
jgi:hypothetical protein